MIQSNEIITGETVQCMCDLYLGGHINDFTFNPFIGISEKNKIIGDINGEFENPRTIYCYGHRLKELVNKLDYFIHPFILISGNSDENITYDDIYLNIANHKKIILWYAQNLCIDHPKLKVLPIGIANSQWPHGNLDAFTNVTINLPDKTNDIYFNFQVNTNYSKRSECYNQLYNDIPFLKTIEPIQNWKRLATYKFCICPEGNGFDSHRLWECFYLKVVPIVIKSDFIMNLKRELNLPLVILDTWSHLMKTKLIYEDYDFDNVPSIFRTITDNISNNANINIIVPQSIFEVVLNSVCLTSANVV